MGDVNEPVSGGEDSEVRKYAPKRVREHPAEPRYVASAPTAPILTQTHQNRWATSALAQLDAQSRAAEGEELTRRAVSGPQLVPDPPVQLETDMSLFGRVALVLLFAAAVAVLIIFAKPLWQSGEALLAKNANTADSSEQGRTAELRPAATPTLQKVESASAAPGMPDLRANNIVPQMPVTSGVQMKQAPVNTASAAATAWDRADNTRRGGERLVRGVTDTEIRFGIAAPLSGAAKELGQNMQLGIETAFKVANAAGGVNGRQLRLIAADDGYEPSRTPAAMKELYDKDQVFGFVGNVGTPTATVALPFALEHKALFYGAFTGAGLLRNDPPDRYVFNYRASYAEETEAIVHYLVKVRHIRPQQIAVFAQNDSYGEAGFSGVAKAVRALGADENDILRLSYQRNTIDVNDAVERLKNHHKPIKAVIMVPTYRAAAKFIEKTRDQYPNMIYTSVSFVGSTALANELMLLGSRYANGVIVTQVVPPVSGHSSLVLDYKSALAKYFGGQEPDFVSLEGYVAANILIAALKQTGPDIDTENLVSSFESMHNLDIGLGTPVKFSRSEHQGVHKVWGTQLDASGHYQPLDLQ
ncbi:MAG TPA: ABC transporter substrate-binding protein [Pseudolabrys sp.]|nr:ABC transporter substrate-binding protein [Pseudolabrys sp.]